MRTIYLLLLVLMAVSCQKSDDQGPQNGQASFLDGLPEKIASKNNEYHFAYNSNKQVTRLRKNPWPATIPYTLDRVDSFFIYYNPDNTIARSVMKNEAPDFGGNRTTRVARFFEYKANRLEKIYQKSSDVKNWFDIYDPTYELQRGVIDHLKMLYIDSLAYDNKGRISEIFRVRVENSYGGNPEGYYLVPINYKKFTYMAGNDSLLQKIISKPDINSSTVTTANFVSYDSTCRNPMYTSLKLAPFITYIDMMPLGQYGGNYGDLGNYLSFVPYFLKEIPEGVVTNTIKESTKTYTSATYGFMFSGGFTYYY